MQKRKRYAVNIDIFQLISKYRDNECLWDWNNKDYKDKALKQKVWERIARHFRTEMTVVKTKVRFLRTAYVSEKKKVDKAKRLGKSYIPGLFYYKYLSFLDDVVICRKAEEELELEKINEFECEKVEISQDCEENDEIENFTKTELVELDVPQDQEYSPELTQVSPVAGYGVVDVVELISKYKDYECLWNIHNKDYKQKGVRNLAWESIASHFGKEVSEVKNKVRRLRTAYVSEKRKIERTKKHRPTLFYYKYLTFLDDIVVCRSGADDMEKTKDFEENIDNRRCNDSDFDNMETNDDYFSKKDVKGSPVSSSTPSSPREPQHKIPAPKILSTRSLQNRISKRQSQRELKYNKAVKDVEECSRNISKHNIYNSFGTTIALQLEQLPLEEATITMSEIHTMITKKILNYFKFSHNGHHNQLKYFDEEECYDDILQAALNEANL